MEVLVWRFMLFFDPAGAGARDNNVMVTMTLKRFGMVVAKAAIPSLNVRVHIVCWRIFGRRRSLAGESS
jgi:hypothetical protein